MKTRVLLPLVPLAIGVIFFGIRRSEHLALQKTLSELEQANPISRADPESLQQSARSSRPALDPDILRDLVSDFIAAEGSPETMTEQEEKERENETFRQLVKVREQLAHASMAEILALIPEGFSFKEHSIETELGVFVGILLDHLQEANPRSFLEIMGSTDIEPLGYIDKATAINQTLIRWAQRSPEEAYAWYQKALREKNPIVESEEFQAARLKILAPGAPEEAITEMLALDLEKEDDIDRLSDLFSGDDPDLEDISKVLSAFDRQSASNQEYERLKALRYGYICDISPDLADRGYQEAHAYIESHFSVTDKANFFRQMSANNLKANEAWLDYGMLHASASTLGDIVRHWAGADPTTSGEWLSKQKDGPKKEAAVYEYARAITKVNPEAAQEWAETLPDSKNKKRLLKQIRAQ